MAEIKNNFLGSKMNRDVDDRLMPPNQYRYALNLEVNRSEGSDVGTLQNALGNALIRNFNLIEEMPAPPAPQLESIGILVDNTRDTVYIFLTNHTDLPYDPVYNPNAVNCIYSYNTKSDVLVKLVSGSFLNFSTANPILGVNILEDLLFWTDNRNQPRKINVSKAANTPNYYTTEDQISVAKTSPIYPINLYKASTDVTGEYETTMYDVNDEFYPDSTSLVPHADPHYQADYAGDPSYLESRMVRFSYRYKFEDGEYSIFAPFTQIAYIPKQDGYFINNDEEEAFRSTIVKFMQNKVNLILLQLILPCAADRLYADYKIIEIDILYKESDALAVSVVDSIPVEKIVDAAGSSTTYEYNYQSKKPFKTLPERDLIRVYDKAPLKALGQEVISNRVVYSNFQDKGTYPKFLDYNVGYGVKYPFGTGQINGTSIIEYPNHTVKQNRNYQVGVILSDKFGRQSGVILSNSTIADKNDSFGASSLFVPYIDSTVNKLDWPGYALKILFNNEIPSTPPDSNTLWPGLYNGDDTSPDYNPLGWYSYKIVVKQTEQDYYNVYLPGLMNAYPEDITKEVGKTSHTVLINDNINKVPRDLKEVGPTQTQFRSSVVLYGRVNNNATGNEQHYPGNTYSFANTIATTSSLFNADLAALPTAYEQFYQVDSNPLIARLSTQKTQGIVSSGNVKKLAVFETKPVDSKLDIYWETSTVGLISELNEAILEGSGGASFIQGWNFNLAEDAANNSTVVSSFSFTDLSGAPVFPTSTPLMEVRNLSNDLRTSKFIIEPASTPGSYRIKTNGYFYYGPNASQLESYRFYFTITAGSNNTVTNITKTGALTNIAPTITNTDTMLTFPSRVVNVYQFNATNGSHVLGNQTTSDLDWSIVSQESNLNGDWYSTTIFSIITNPGTPNGMLQELNQIAVGLYRVTVRVTDAGGLYDEYTIMLSYLPAYTYNCVPLQGGCIMVAGQGGQFATLSACQSGCTTCNTYSVSCASYMPSCRADYLTCTGNTSSYIQIPGGQTYTITCAKTGSVYSSGGGVTITQGSLCQS